MVDAKSLSDAAMRYLNAGLCVLPARRGEKRPAIGTWKRYQQRRPTEAEISAWFANHHDAICILCGQVSGAGSGGGEMIDFDAGGALFDAWAAKIPPDLLAKLVIESTQRNGRHVFYRGEQAVCGNMKLAQRRSGTSGGGDQVETLIETRGEGGLFLCAPTPGYELIQGDLTNPPVLTAAERDVLLHAAWELNEYVPPVVDGSTHSAHSPQRMPLSGGQRDYPSNNADRPGDDFNVRGDPRQVLEQCGWVRVRGGENEYWRRPGKESGTSATLKDRVFYVFSSNAAPFEPNRAYSPFAVYTLLEHGGDFEQAARSLAQLGYGTDSTDSPQTPSGRADISAIVRMSEMVGACPSDTPESGQTMDLCDEQGAPASDDPDPGPTPDALLHIPGFVGEIIDFCMTGAPYPSLGMAFCGALAMQAHLCGRKVREAGDLRTNIYILALASSSAGKNYPRQINSHLAISANLAETVRRKFSSGEGIEDRLEVQPCTMYQTDEIDSMLQSVTKAKDARHESILSMLLELYSSANMMYPMRTRAGKQAAGVVHQPHLTIFGTATPGHYYEAMSQRMLTNGFFARMIIVDTGKRALGNDAVPVDQMPPRLVETAQWWTALQPGEHRGNLLGFFPKPIVVPYDPQAKRLADDFRREADEQYGKAEDRNDDVAMTVWGRANENARKLALLYACSENPRNPAITLPGVQWATAFITHQTRRMLFMARQYVARDEFDGHCKHAIRILRDWHAREGAEALMPAWQFRRRLNLHPTAFKDVMFELEQRRLAICDVVMGKTKPKQGYRLL